MPGLILDPRQGQLFGFKNKIINPAFDAWQRGTSFAAIANGAYHADRYAYAKSGSMVHTVAQDASYPTVAQAGIRGNFSLKVSVTTIDNAIAAGELSHIEQRVEGYAWAPLAQQTFTLSFWVYSNKTGTYCVAFRNQTQDRSYVAEYTVDLANTWEKKTITVLASPAAGTWNYVTGLGLYLSWTLDAGSTYQGSANTWASANILATSNQVNFSDSTSNVWYLAYGQLEAGSVATPFEARPYVQELALCKRYYQLINAAPGVGASTTEVDFNPVHVPQMRVAPSYSQTGVVTVSDCFALDFTQSATSVSIVNSYATAQGSRIRLGNFTNINNAGRPYLLTSQGIAADAEL